MDAPLISISSFTYLLSSLLFISGLRYLGSPVMAKTGNFIAGAGMALAILVTIGIAFWEKEISLALIVTLAALLIGSFFGMSLADQVKMTNMPQLVSLFNATGGGCAMLLGLMEAKNQSFGSSTTQLLLASSVAIGAATLSGSVIAYYKLKGMKSLRAVDLKIIVFGSRLLLLAVLALIPTMVLSPGDATFQAWMMTLACLALLYGFAFVLPIGGADMPVVISLLNALTGIATGLAGINLDNKVMIVGGVLVGAAGIILTSLMCKSMNRSLFQVISGVIKSGTKSTLTKTVEFKETTTGQAALKLGFADKVGIVPGYGMAVAQAQHSCAALQDQLERRGIEVEYIIHPVAGRMPGHMNVLLAEAEIDYEKMLEMEEVKGRLSDFDVLLVVGANDVVNPAAVEDVDSPLYGMPIIEAHRAKNVVVLKRGMSFGYAGVPNTLFEKSNCEVLFGEADHSLSAITSEIKLI